MINLKRNLFTSIILSVLGFIILFSTPVLAASSIFDQSKAGLQNATDQAYGGGTKVGIDENSLLANVIIFVNYLLTFLGIIFFALLLYSGFLWMTAQGSEERLNKAKRITREVVIGLIIIILARVITEFILNEVSTVIVNNSQ